MLFRSVNERTIRRWKATGDWNTKRKQFLKENTITNEDIYYFVRKMLHEIIADIDNGKRVNPARYYKFLNLTEKMLKKKRKITLLNFINTYNKKTNVDKEIEMAMQAEFKNYFAQILPYLKLL